MRILLSLCSESKNQLQLLLKQQYEILKGEEERVVVTSFLNFVGLEKQYKFKYFLVQNLLRLMKISL